MSSSPTPNHPSKPVRLPLLPRSLSGGRILTKSSSPGSRTPASAAHTPAARSYNFRYPYTQSVASTPVHNNSVRDEAELLRLKSLLHNQKERLASHTQPQSQPQPQPLSSIAITEPFTVLNHHGVPEHIAEASLRRDDGGPLLVPSTEAKSPSNADSIKLSVQISDYIPPLSLSAPKAVRPPLAPVQLSVSGENSALTSPRRKSTRSQLREVLEDDPEVQAIMESNGKTPAGVRRTSAAETQFTTVAFSTIEEKQKPTALKTGKEVHVVPLSVQERSQASITLGRMSMASSSVQHITDGAIAMMEMLADRPDVILPSPLETGVVRTGDVLSAKHILKLDLQDALIGRRGSTGIISGAPYFRIVPKLNIAGVAQANISGIRTILNELYRANIGGTVIWVNLREEPVVYINNSAHIVRTRQDPLVPVTIPNVTGPGIEVVEAKLKKEVLAEAANNGGNLSVHVEGLDGLWEDQWECASEANVFTTAEVFEQIAATKDANMSVTYVRRPITANVGPQTDDFDFVFETGIAEPNALIVFNCQTGRGRTSAMMQIANIVRFYQYCHDDVTANVRVLKGSSKGLVFRTIQKIVSVLPNGKLHEKRLTVLMDIADKGYSLSDHIREAFSVGNDNYEEAAMRLHQYALFLVFSYYCELRLWNKSTTLSFTEWLNKNQEIKLLINSVREKVADQLKEERILAPAAKGKEANASRIIRQRHGNVLSAGRILCSIPMSKDSAPVKELRQLAPDVPIFTCGRLSSSARTDLVREIREAFPDHQRVHWLSLRAEPMVQINGINYTLTDFNAPVLDTEVGATMHISLEAMEKVEERLKLDVEDEARERNGEIILHRITENGERETMWVQVEDVQTPYATMQEFIEECNIDYHRVPIPFSGQMLPSDIDPLLRYFSNSRCGPHDIIVINDSEGTLRSTVALNINTLYRASQLTDLREISTVKLLTETLEAGKSGSVIRSANMASTVPVEKDEVPEEHVEILLASTICQMFAAGSLLRAVDAVMSLGGRGPKWNVLHAVDYLKRAIATAGPQKPKALLDALHALRSYLLVLLVAIYLDEEGRYNEEMPFSAWLESRTELSFIIDGIENRGEAALKYVPTANLMVADLSRRSGDVLTANFCLKADHFPGCQKKGLRPEVCGAPNFRKVKFVNVYGVAIPTRMGIDNILSLLGATDAPMQTYPNQQNDAELYIAYACPHMMTPDFDPQKLSAPLRGSVVWVNLREEPLLYVGDRPFVFRDLSAPYVNVELTGIQTDKIEFVEMRLKDDVMKEATQYDGKFLVHDEGKPGELVGSWEEANNDTVKTMREIFDDLGKRGARCRMVRLPVTDEQSPAFNDFDDLVAELLPSITESVALDDTVSFIFNCQMGRGRTTTGMVVCCLIVGCVVPSYYEELHKEYNPLYKPGASELSQGEYGVIQQLKRVLFTGRQAKYKLDLVLEACSKMQNLRTAIEDLAIVASSPDSTEAGRARAHHAGIHYLVRYFNLIVFTVYLDEEYDRDEKRVRHTFTQWMALHPELTTLSATAALTP